MYELRDTPMPSRGHRLIRRYRPMRQVFFETEGEPIPVMTPIPVIVKEDESSLWRKVFIGAIAGLIVGLLVGRR